MTTDPAILNELQDLRRQVAELLEVVGALRAENAVLKAENAALKVKVVELERRLGMDSSNSSKPPSSNSPFKRPPPTPPSGRKPGGQPGHPGKFRKLSTTPDVVVPCKPCACEHCYAELGDHDLVGEPMVREVIDIEVKHHVRHIKLFEARCPACHKKTRAQAPAGTPPGTFGPSVDAAIGLLTMHGVSRGDVQKFIKALFDLDISIGAIDQACTHVADASADAVEEIARHIEAAGVVHADETGWDVRGKLGWLWVALTAEAELFALTKSATAMR